MSKKPNVKSSKIVYKGFYDVQQDVLERADGQTIAYSTLVLPTHAVSILAKDPSGRWIMNYEYRHPTGEYVLGCPGGRLEKDEDPALAAQRELFEETGYWADEIRLIGSCYPFPAVCNQKLFYYYAPAAVHQAKQHLDPFEYIEVKLMSHEELTEAIRTGTNIDGLALTALWYWGKSS